MSAETGSKLKIIHFNDVYNITERKKEPVGGASRFATALKRHEDALILFSGDAYNPSLLSTVTKGSHIVPIFNLLGIHTATYGNHDFDAGLDHTFKLSKQLNFPWVLSNMHDPTTQKPLAQAVEYLIIDETSHPKQCPKGVRIGVIGLGEKEWLNAVATLPKNIEYEEFVKCAQRYCKMLKEKEHCNLIVAMTHMRLPNDELLASKVPDIDLLLGGHDHFYKVFKHPESGVLVSKSGTDFREFTLIDINVRTDRSDKQRHDISFQRVEITCAQFKPDPDMEALVDKISKEIDKQMMVNIATVTEPIDSRSESNRTRESTAGNFVTDVMRTELGADIALLNGGSLRSDSIYPRGPFTLKNLLSILPFPDLGLSIEVSGQQIWDALENSVAKWPAHDGRFLQVSGIQFTFDGREPAGKRMVSASVLSDDGEIPLDLKKQYVLATTPFLYKGFENYTMFKGHPCTKVIVDDENARTLPTMVRLECLKRTVVNKFSKRSRVVRTGANKFLSKINRSLTVSESENNTNNNVAASSSNTLAPLASGRQLLRGSSFEAMVNPNSGLKKLTICPKIEGRIINLATQQSEVKMSTTLKVESRKVLRNSGWDVIKARNASDRYSIAQLDERENKLPNFLVSSD